MRALEDLAVVAGRLALALIFLIEGWLKLRNSSAIVDYMQGYGISPTLLPVVILTELGGGLLVAVGLLTRLSALALAGFCGLTAIFFHADFADQDQMINFLKNVSIAGGFLMLFAHGPGAWSIDAWWRRRSER